MRPNELMIGDWVYNKHHKKNIKITPFDFFTHGHLPSGRQYFIGEPELVSGRDLEPIPLTKEILEKICNKVDPIEGNIHHYVEYRFGEDILISSEDDYPLMLYFENTPGEHAHVKVEYVHELQHWLRLLKYEKEIEL